jgi:drug/metabolite transporter (DMT)-like permease
LIPVLASIILYGEKPNLQILIGFALVLVTIYFFYLSLKNHGNSSESTAKYFYLFLLLVGIGFIDLSMKMFERNFLIDEKGTFVFQIFSFAFLYTLIRILIGKIKFDKETYKIGLILGFPNVLAIHFLLASLSQVPAIVVFPVLNIGVIVLTAFAAYLFWKEKINLYGKIALTIGIAAILLLKL